MRLRVFFFILVVILLSLGVFLLTLLMRENNFAFYIAEIAILLSLVFLVVFYRKVLRPLDSIANGMDLLREQDFGSRLAPVGQKEADRIVEVFNRMMAQLKEERLRVREQNHFLDLLIGASPMGIVILDFDYRITSANDAAVRMLGFASSSDILGLSFSELDSTLAEAINRIDSDKIETVRLSDAMIYRCSRLSFMDHGYAHPFVLIESLTAEVVKAEKLAYEKVIRMIAHEVNNTLAGVSSAFATIDDSLSDMADSEDLREVLNVCGERCLSLSRFISAYADVVKIPEPNIVECNLNETVAACKIFMESLCLDRNIRLHLNICETAPMVDIDPSLFEQVMVNILKNAVESIDNEGEILITTTAAPLMLEISDNGAGIAPDVAQRLFTPFYSSKPNGQGLGLLFVSEVLKKHGCRFSLQTYSDGITRFRINFPQHT